MDRVVEILEEIVRYSVHVGITLVEMAGICVLMVTAFKGIMLYIRHDPLVRLRLAEGIALALEFKLGGEVLRTVIIRDWNETAILGATILLRAALTLLLHWEIHSEKSEIGLKAKT